MINSLSIVSVADTKITETISSLKKSMAEIKYEEILLFTSKNLNKKNLLHTVMNLVHNEKALNKMRKASKAIGKPNATSEIVDIVLEQKL